MNKDCIIGLDIGSSSIKMARFLQREGELTLKSIVLKEFKNNSGDEPAESEIVSLLTEIFSGINTKTCNVIVSLNCPQTSIKKIIAPYMPKSELNNAIKLHAKNYFPFPIDDAFLDYEIIGDMIDKGVRKYEVVVGVSPKKTVAAYLALLNKADIHPSSFVCSSYALHQAAKHTYRKDNDAKCIVDIGERHTELILFKNGSFLFSRKIPISSRDFTRALTSTIVSGAGKIQLSFSEAEDIKRSVGIPNENDTGEIGKKISKLQVLSMLRMPVDQLVNEISRSLDYYRESAGSEKIGSLVIYGGGASLGGLIPYLSRELDMDVRLGDPLENIPLEGGAIPERSKISHRLELAIGAAMSHNLGMNLLPPEVKEATKRIITRGTIEVAATFIIIASILLYTGIKIQTNNLKKRIAVANLEISSLKPQIMKLEAQELANAVLVNEPQWEDLLTELSNVMPSNMHLTSFNMQNNALTIKGIVAGRDGEQVLANFILTLERGIFNNVKLVESKDIAEEAGVAFEIKCWVDYEA